MTAPTKKEFKDSRKLMNSDEFADNAGIDRDSIESEEVYAYLDKFYIEIHFGEYYVIVPHNILTPDVKEFENINEAEDYFWEQYVQYEI